MNQDGLKRKFARMGAKVMIHPSGSGQRSPLVLDVVEERGREYFDLRIRPDAAVDLDVITVDADRRHLLLLEKSDGKKHKYLCGHDERHWFVAAVPESARGVTSIETAFRALQPEEVANRQSRRPLSPRERWRRRNAAYIRQGEWFFVPAPDLQVAPRLILNDEPISRGRGKPHRVERLYRCGGETVYVSRQTPGGLTESKYREILKERPESSRWRWNVMRRNPEVYAEGRVSHPDHATIVLKGWHRVFMNTENRAEAGVNVVFLD